MDIVTTSQPHTRITRVWFPAFAGTTVRFLLD